VSRKNGMCCNFKLAAEAPKKLLLKNLGDSKRADSVPSSPKKLRHQRPHGDLKAGGDAFLNATKANAGAQLMTI
jgi:hypothetical protein